MFIFTNEQKGFPLPADRKLKLFACVFPDTESRAVSWLTPSLVSQNNHHVTWPFIYKIFYYQQRPTTLMKGSSPIKLKDFNICSIGINMYTWYSFPSQNSFQFKYLMPVVIAMVIPRGFITSKNCIARLESKVRSYLNSGGKQWRVGLQSEPSSLYIAHFRCRT